MEQRTHVLLGAACGLGYAWTASVDGWVAGSLAALAAVVAPLPDVDQAGWFRSLDRWLPDEWLGNGGPLQHRGVTHWAPGYAAAGFVLWPTTSGLSRLALIGVLVGLLSHILGDFVVGKAGYGRAAGVPVAPWWAHAGLALDCGGLAERLVIRPLLLLAVPVAAYYVIFGGSL